VSRRKIRDEVLSEAIAYHLQHIGALQRACDEAWTECAPTVGLHAIEIHRKAVDYFRALKIAGT
jgi:hypothetical protein